MRREFGTKLWRCFAVVAILLGSQVAMSPAEATPGPLTTVSATEISITDLLAIVDPDGVSVEIIANEDGAIIGDIIQKDDGSLHEVYLGDPNRFEEVWTNTAFELHDPSTAWIRDYGTGAPFVELFSALPDHYEWVEDVVDGQGAIVGGLLFDPTTSTYKELVFVDLDKIDITTLALYFNYYTDANPPTLWYGTGNLTLHPDTTTPSTLGPTTSTTSRLDLTTTTRAPEPREPSTSVTVRDTTTSTTLRRLTTAVETTTTEASTTTTTEASTTTPEGSSTTEPMATTTTHAITTTTGTSDDEPGQPPTPPAKTETPKITG